MADERLRQDVAASRSTMSREAAALSAAAPPKRAGVLVAIAQTPPTAERRRKADVKIEQGGAGDSPAHEVRANHTAARQRLSAGDSPAQAVQAGCERLKQIGESVVEIAGTVESKEAGCVGEVDVFVFELDVDGDEIEGL